MMGLFGGGGFSGMIPGSSLFGGTLPGVAMGGGSSIPGMSSIPGADWIKNMLNPEKGYQNAQNASNDYYNQSNQMLAPYTQAGMTANANMNDMYAKLSNPQELQSQWANGYQQSPYAHQLQQSSMDSGLNAAGSMGLLGSSAALSNIQHQGSDIANADFQNYMADLMDKYMKAWDISKTQFQGGANAAGVGAGHAMDQGTTQANLEFGKYNAGPEMLMNLLMGGGKIAMGGM